MSSNRLRIAILGASGYTGAEMVRLLSRHPEAEIVLMTADRHAGEPYDTVFPHLGGLGLPDLISIDDVEWAGLEIDVVFCGLPHGTTQEVIAGILHETHHGMVDELMRETTGDLAATVPGQPRVIDISADFRLEDGDAYAEWYGHEHLAPHLQGEAVYGLTEFARDRLPTARLVACPGCYPTGAILPLAPLLAAGRIVPDSIVIDAKSGVTGAGRAAKQQMLFGEVAEGAHAYGIASHRHTPEMEQELSKAAGRPVRVSFTPHLVPMNRGILTTTYVELANGAGVDDLREALEERYADEPFVRLLPEGRAPATRDVRGSNYCLIGVFADRLPGRAIVLSAIDNLVKGASGAAVQNMNVMYGLDETAGLEQQPLFP
ncbi:MAG: N-acetyl-gamma-glutamyl-phosphate reductase [Alphaproteobacteria bacterium]|jgi:N-acetyl-gamma-glutamyl-phosphate reductase|nr:N-acetyl-gamma-glutamyl-phosphate reductase [Alphaproteobacteria bacterium]